MRLLASMTWLAYLHPAVLVMLAVERLAEVAVMAALRVLCGGGAP